MAFKSFSKLSSRNQSSLVSQINQLISYYNEIFASRERIYLKNLSKQDGSIYWLEDEDKKLAAMTLVDPNYIFEVDGIKVLTVGHTISKRPGQMDRILAHVLEDHKDKSLVLLCRPVIAKGIQTDTLGLVPFSPLELLANWPSLANQLTDYFNSGRETLAHGLDRKMHWAYLKLSASDQAVLEKTSPDLLKLFYQKKEAQVEVV